MTTLPEVHPSRRRREACPTDSSSTHGGPLIPCFQPNEIWRWTREGGLELLLQDWTGECVLSPTNVAFYGERRHRPALAPRCGHDPVTVCPRIPVRR